MSHDKFKNHPSLTVVKDEGLCKGKELGCMAINTTRRTIIWKGRRINDVRCRVRKRAPLQGPKSMPNVELAGLRTESKLYCIGAIPTTVGTKQAIVGIAPIQYSFNSVRNPAAETCNGTFSPNILCIDIRRSASLTLCISD